MEMAGSRQFMPPKKTEKPEAKKCSRKKTTIRKEQFTAVQREDGAEWATTLSDDCHNAIEVVLQTVKSEDVNKESVAEALQMVVQFAVQGRLDVKGKMLATWTKVRRHMKAFLIDMHKGVINVDFDMQDPDLKEECEASPEQQAMQQTMERLTEKVAQSIKSAVGAGNRLDAPRVSQSICKMSKAYVQSLGEVWEKMGNDSQQLISAPPNKQAHNFLEIIGETVYRTIPEDVCILEA